MKSADTVIALAGQPNCGKSTVFNALTGARQHVANWPGVTVDRKSGWLRVGGRRVEVVDLPGTYSLTSQSPEERVARDFLLSGRAALAVNVIDATSLKHGLTLTIQLLEMGIPLIVNLNMMDKALNRDLSFSPGKLENLLGASVVTTSMTRRRGAKDLLSAIEEQLHAPPPATPPTVNYGKMEPFLRAIEDKISAETPDHPLVSLRWAAVRLMEGPTDIRSLIQNRFPGARGVFTLAEESRLAFEEQTGLATVVHIALCRRQLAETIAGQCVESLKRSKPSTSERIDQIVCHRIGGPLILITVIYLLYYLSIVQGYRLTEYTWPILAGLRQLAAAALPTPGFIEIPLLTALVLWLIDSVNALLNYLPIFFILFALIAVLEDTGYMPRMAFIMDRALNRFGLHGQSVLPMVLGGVYVGGCAVPAVMSCKGIPDERSRLATILTIPLLNCMAKVPLYILLINAYFPAHKGWAMFFISSISLLIALPVAKVLTLTVLKNKDTSPFVMAMPDYHLPTLRNVLVKALERVWLYLKKITTIVAAVAAVLFVLLQYPGLSAEKTAAYEKEKIRLLNQYRQSVATTSFANITAEEDIVYLVLYWNAYKKARMTAATPQATASINERFKNRNSELFHLVQPGNNQQAIKASQAIKRLARDRDGLLADMRKDRLEHSLLGRAGKSLEPFTALAGFDWKINVALLSALAAKENTVATLGAIYAPDENQGSLENRMTADATGLTPMHALALMLFMVLYPPCIAAAIAVKVQTGSVKWMFFSMAYPAFLGFACAVLIFSGGDTLGLSGIQAMTTFYVLALSLTIGAGLVKYKNTF